MRNRGSNAIDDGVPQTNVPVLNGPRRKQLEGPVRAVISALTADGRGLTRVDGKAVLVDGALPGEEVCFLYTGKRRGYWEGRVQEVLVKSTQRVEPRCPHFGVCGGCVLQHLAPAAQVVAKQRQLLESFDRIAAVRPTEVLAPVTGPTWGYRRKARLSVRYVEKKGRALVGFREKRHSFVAELTRCEILHPSVGLMLAPLSTLIGKLRCRKRIPQIEIAVGENATALVLRILEPPKESDLVQLNAFAEDHGVRILLQSGDAATVVPLAPVDDEGLFYKLDVAAQITIRFRPLEFIQVNAYINQLLVRRALELLKLHPDDRVLDLFCGLGNFSLPIAQHVTKVVGVDVDETLIAHARYNAQVNGITNVEYFAADLAKDAELMSWDGQHYSKVLLDPPRSGAGEILGELAALGPVRIVYVSCHPDTLARDAAVLVHKFGYRLAKAGVIDMFPHTRHIESIALFCK